jgi:hypothetical protein
MAIATSKMQPIPPENASTTNAPADVLRKSTARSYAIAFAWPLLTVMCANEIWAASPANGATDTERVKAQPVLRMAQAAVDFSIADVSGISGEPVKLAISLSDDVLKSVKNPEGPVFIMFHGLPPGLGLSAGFRVNEVWAVSLKDVSQLALSAPQDYSGTFNLTAILHRGKQATSLTYAFKVTLMTASEATSATRQETATPPNAAHGSPETEKAALPLTQEAELLDRAERLFKNGDFVSARLIYGALAERGSQKAALRMAKTYDPEVLGSFFMVGIKPNLEKARHWYTRAMELGAVEARDRLNVLSKAEAR